MSSQSEKVVRTFQSKSIILDMCVLLGNLPSEDHISDFMMRLLDVLVEKGFGPDAVGYRFEDCTLTLTYRGLAELGKVDQVMREAIDEAEHIVRREQKRRDAGFNRLQRFSPGNMGKRGNPLD